MPPAMGITVPHRGFDQQAVPVNQDFNDMGIGLENMLAGKQFRIVPETTVIGYRIGDGQVILLAHVIVIHPMAG